MADVDPRAVEALDAHLSYLALLDEQGGGEVLREEGFSCFRSPSDTPFLVNAAARTDPAADAAAVVLAAQRFFGRQGFELICLADRDADLRAAGLAADLRAGGEADPLMALGTPVVGVSAGLQGIDIRQVGDAAGVADLATVNQDASAAYEGFPADFFARVFERPATVLNASITAYVAYEDGEPLATAQDFRHGDLCYVAWVAVARRAMRRGLGRLVTAQVVNGAFAQGARAALLVASPMGAPLYRKMGFVDVGALDTVYAGRG